MSTPDTFTNFGELLKHLRLRAQLTQRELALAVGYHHAHLSRLENNQRIPDGATIKALFVPALGLDEEPEWAERLLVLAAQGRGESAPQPSAPTQTPPRNIHLPVTLTSLLGREDISARAQRLLLQDNIRLLTFVGPPGIGKTRLAIHVAAEVADHFRDGVFFVDLTAVQDAEWVPSVVASALDVKESAKQILVTSLLASLMPRNILLVLDNFEQVMNAAPMVSELLRGARQVKIIVTSREPLHISGEQEFPVSPLPEDVRVELFVQRAQAVEPDFELTPQNTPIIAEICKRLDGLPLAIELAAARVKMFSVQAMLDRLDRRLQWLTGGAREGPAWRQTLRGAIDWSYNLLAPDEQTAFARLAVFAGGCTPETAEAVTGMSLDILLALADKNLITLAARGPQDDPRLTLLETLREYAAERIKEKPDELAAISQKHAAHFLALAELAAPELEVALHAGALRRLEVEHDNLRAALAWSMQHQPEIGVRLVLGLSRFWYLRGHFSEGRRWQTTALQHASAPQRLTLTRQLGEACWNLGEFAEARTYLEENVTLARTTQNKSALADGLNLLGRVVKDMGSYPDALIYLEEGLGLARAQENPSVLIPLLRNLGNINVDLGRMDQALNYFEESLVLARRFHDRLGIAGALNNMGIVYIALKDYERARASFLESLPIFQEDGMQFGTTVAVVNIGRVAHAQGALDEAQKNFETSLRLAREIGKKWSIAYALSNLGLVACDQERWEVAERHFRESVQTALETDAPPRALDALGGWAILLARTGKAEKAAELLGLVRSHPSTEHEALDRANSLMVDLQKSLPADMLNEALQRGAATTLEGLARALVGGSG